MIRRDQSILISALNYRLPLSFLSRTNVLDWQNNAENTIQPMAVDLTELLAVILLFVLCIQFVASVGFTTRTIPIMLAKMFII